MKTTVSLVKCTSYNTSEVEVAVRRAVDLCGGISSFIKPGQNVLIKPNLLSAKEPERAITTHPEILRALIRLVREAGATPRIGDSPGGAIKGIDRVWDKTGMKRLAAEENVELVNFETAGAAETAIDHPLSPTIHISRAVLEADVIINVPKLKTHGLMYYTGTIKNLYGCIPGLRKAEYHKRVPFPADFGRLLGEIYLAVRKKIVLNVIDGVMGMEGNGPSAGDIRKLDCIIAGADAVAVDTAATHLLGFTPLKVHALSYLASKQAGETSLSNIDISGDSPSSFDFRDFKFPSNWYLSLVPRFLVDLLAPLIWMRPYVVTGTCIKCMMCVESCPVKAIRKDGPAGKPEVIDNECISCLCCHELCPVKAIELKSSWLSKRLIRQK